ncbi:hypothetical protein EK21DRAFT_118826 [Setomelanomma holmii]|uniref:Uncharacterized protein n=1 Tax=Setomelanomma holmii TaxID=210430 RepID=A0A9P4GX89_9PLEO|nr:hypothetical protein EK21DRAFT_118826 [Setomelanomma holmii]
MQRNHDDLIAKLQRLKIENRSLIAKNRVLRNEKREVEDQFLELNNVQRDFAAEVDRQEKVIDELKFGVVENQIDVDYTKSLEIRVENLEAQVKSLQGGDQHGEIDSAAVAGMAQMGLNDVEMSGTDGTLQPDADASSAEPSSGNNVCPMLLAKVKCRMAKAGEHCKLGYHPHKEASTTDVTSFASA